MTQRQPPRPADPGEVRGTAKGVTPTPAAGVPSPSSSPGTRPTDLLRAALAGLVVAFMVALVLGALRAIFDIGPGLLVVAAVGGWLLGAALAWGAWGSAAHLPNAGVQSMAAVLGAVAWLVGSAIDYLISLALLPASSRTFAERLSDQPFPAWLAPQLSLVDAAQIAILVIVAWRSAR